jgi:hypothetical protein
MNFVRVVVEFLLFIFIAGAVVTLLRMQARQAKDRSMQTGQVKDIVTPRDQ